MSRRSIVRSTLAAFLALGMVGTALAQSNVAQTIRYGEVVSMEKTMVKDRSTGTGTRTGATVGAVAGYAAARSAGPRAAGSRNRRARRGGFS